MPIRGEILKTGARQETGTHVRDKRNAVHGTDCIRSTLLRHTRAARDKGYDRDKGQERDM